MYAVFEDGSRQYRVTQGDRVRIDHRPADLGSRIELNRVLMFADGDTTRIGQPVVEGVRVIGEVSGHPTIKVQIQKFRRRKNYRRLTGHRQKYVEVLIKHILLPGEDIPPEEERRPVHQEETAAAPSSPPPEHSEPKDSPEEEKAPQPGVTPSSPAEEEEQKESDEGGGPPPEKKAPEEDGA